jgi:hypothetical protein
MSMTAASMVLTLIPPLTIAIAGARYVLVEGVLEHGAANHAAQQPAARDRFKKRAREE